MPEYNPTWESLQRYSAPNWFRDAKFGIFIHWGVYSVPAFSSEWYARNMYLAGTNEHEFHTTAFGPTTTYGYKEFIPQLNGEKFDAQAWLELFKASGAKYIVPVAEHHDGFAMYDCSYSKWNAVNMGPKRDIIGELANATRDAGLVFGLSSHRAENWWFFSGGRQSPSDVQDPAFADLYGRAEPCPEHHSEAWKSLDWQPRPDKAFLDDWLARIQEVVEKYQPQLVWFDWWIEQTVFRPYLQRFAAEYYNLGERWRKGVVINYKNAAFEPGTAVWDVERGQLSAKRELPWQNDTSISQNSWGYVRNHVYKKPGQIITDLVDIISKNGCLLLNIGPKPDGTIPSEEVEILREIGRWLAVNGEAVYGTRPWHQFGEGPTEISEGYFTDSSPKAFTPQDIRFTKIDSNLYAHIFAAPGHTVSIQSLTPTTLPAEQIIKISLLGMDAQLRWEQDANGLTVYFPEIIPGKYVWVIKIATAW